MELAYSNAARIWAAVRVENAERTSAGVAPSASISRTCQTITRVPLNVGFPWQMAGSAMMCLWRVIRMKKEEERSGSYLSTDSRGMNKRASWLEEVAR